MLTDPKGCGLLRVFDVISPGCGMALDNAVDERHVLCGWNLKASFGLQLYKTSKAQNKPNLATTPTAFPIADSIEQDSAARNTHLLPSAGWNISSYWATCSCDYEPACLVRHRTQLTSAFGRCSQGRQLSFAFPERSDRPPYLSILGPAVFSSLWVSGIWLCCLLAAGSGYHHLQSHAQS